MTNKTKKKTEKGGHKTSILIGAVLLAFAAGILTGIVLARYKTEKTDSSSDIAEQIADHESAVSQNPENVEAWIHLGNLYFDSDLPAKAITAYEKALKLNPKDADVWTDMGVMHRKSGNFEKAIQCFDQAVTINPKHEISRFNKGIVLMYDLKNKKEAIREWEELLNINPFAMAPDGISVDKMLSRIKQQ